MVTYKLDICYRCEAVTWTRPTENKGPVCRACHIELFFANILYKPIGYRLLDWQRKDLRAIYGTVDIETGERQYQSAYIEIAKKNGKSFLVGGLPLYHLMNEGIEYPKAYGAAAAKDQAGLVFQAAAQLYRGSKLLQDKLKLLESTKRIVRRDGSGYYCVIAADGDVIDGVEPTLTIQDELHRWKTSKAKTLHQVLTSGDISVAEPLRIAITTAGDRYESEIWWMARERARMILDGSLKSPRSYAAIYAADPVKHKEDPNYWKSLEARLAANPSHVALGGFLKDDRITGKLEEIGESAYKRLHLNICNEGTERWMPLSEWNECGKAPLRGMTGKRCWIGVDLSKNTDFTAVVAGTLDDDGSIDIQPYFFVPLEQVPKLEKKLKLDLRRWISKGLLLTTPGPAIDLECIREQIRLIADVAKVEEVCYDPRYAWEFIGGLVNEGLTCVEVKQWGKYLDAPMQWLMKAVLERRIRHGAHEVMDWHMECTTVKVDKDGLMQPDKQYLDRDARRIDGVSALITLLVRMIVNIDVRADSGVVVVDL